MSILPQLVRRRARLALLSAGVRAGEDGVEGARPGDRSTAEEAELSEEWCRELRFRSTIDYLIGEVTSRPAGVGKVGRGLALNGIGCVMDKCCRTCASKRSRRGAR